MAQVREELRLYNPEFVRRPHVVALNKTDVLGESSDEWAQSIREGILAGAKSEEEGVQYVSCFEHTCRPPDPACQCSLHRP